MWTVQEAKAKLSEVLQRARNGEPQVIGSRDSCVVLSMEEYKRLSAQEEKPHFGRWLVDNLAGIGEIELPSRDEARPSPFEGWTEADFGE